MQNIRFKQLILTAALICGFSVSALAEQIVVPVGQQASDKQSVERPRNGIQKDQVENIFGSPENKTEAVGEPPISSWEYADYIVYFEYDRVLHSVLKRNP